MLRESRNERDFSNPSQLEPPTECIVPFKAVAKVMYREPLGLAC
jgi:hypothetical protein